MTPHRYAIELKWVPNFWCGNCILPVERQSHCPRPRQGEGLGNEGDNTYALIVGVNANGDVVVGLRLQNFAANTSTLIDNISIEAVLASADEIELIFTKAEGSDDLIAQFFIYDVNNSILMSGALGATTELDIYNGEDYIRAQFGSSARIAVPEPATLALLGIGLAGFAFSRRKRNV